jgi:hypothetical protein
MGVMFRISAPIAVAIAAVLLATPPARTQQTRIEADQIAARAFQQVKVCVSRELERAPPLDVEDALRVILGKNCRPEYFKFLESCAGLGLAMRDCVCAIQSWAADRIHTRQ